jgi:hypothetical protein
MTTADEYRKRAATVTKAAKKRKAKGDRLPLEKKVRALSEMADNEDWLAGTIKPKEPKVP